MSSEYRPVCFGVAGFLMVAIVVTLLLYKKRVVAEKRAVLEHKAAEIRNRVAGILSLGGICSQTDADGWQEYRCYDWGDVINCYIKNIDNHQKILVICPIESAISVEQIVTVRRIVAEQKVGVLNADVVVASDLRGYIELCLDMSDIIFAQPYYHCISLGVASTYIPVMNFLKGREYIDNNPDTTTDSENMEDVVFRKEDILY